MMGKQAIFGCVREDICADIYGRKEVQNMDSILKAITVTVITIAIAVLNQIKDDN